MNSMRRQVTTLLIALWLGSFTFYAAVVVPIGSEVLGKMNQGLVTQRVAVWINVFSLVLSVVLLADLERRGGVVRLMAACSFAMATVSLVVLHRVLSGYLSGQDLTLGTPSEFYRCHQAYLIVSTVQWVIALVMAYHLMREPVAPGTDAKT
jgi:hypothetical protein